MRVCNDVKWKTLAEVDREPMLYFFLLVSINKHLIGDHFRSACAPYSRVLETEQDAQTPPSIVMFLTV